MLHSRSDRRAMRRQIERDNAGFPAHLVSVSPLQWPASFSLGGSPRMAVYRSREFLVQVFAEADGVVRLSVNRCKLDEATLMWSAAITWDELQRLKAEAGFGDRDAVEFYPRDLDVVNVANMRHLWVMPDGVRLPYAWRNDRG